MNTPQQRKPTFHFHSSGNALLETAMRTSLATGLVDDTVFVCRTLESLLVLNDSFEKALKMDEIEVGKCEKVFKSTS